MQAGGDGVGVELAGGDVFDEFAPFVLADGVLEGALEGLGEEGLDFAAHLALGALREGAAFEEVGVVALDGVGELGNALVFDGGGFKDGDTPGGGCFVMLATGGIEAEEHGEFGDGLVGARFVGFAYDEDVGDFEDAGFDGLDFVAHAGGGDDEDGVGGAHDFDFGLAGAEGFDEDGVVGGGVEGADDVAGGGRETTEAAAGGHAADEDVGVTGEFHHADAVAEDGTAAEGAAGIDGDNGYFVLAVAEFADEVGEEGAFAGTGSAGDADDVGVAGVEMEFGEVAAGDGHVVFDEGDHAGERAAVSGEQAINEGRWVLHGVFHPYRSAVRRSDWILARTKVMISSVDVPGPKHPLMPRA